MAIHLSMSVGYLSQSITFLLFGPFKRSLPVRSFTLSFVCFCCIIWRFLFLFASWLLGFLASWLFGSSGRPPFGPRASTSSASPAAPAPAPASRGWRATRPSPRRRSASAGGWRWAYCRRGKTLGRERKRERFWNPFSLIVFFGPFLSFSLLIFFSFCFPEGFPCCLPLFCARCVFVPSSFPGRAFLVFLKGFLVAFPFFPGCLVLVHFLFRRVSLVLMVPLSWTFLETGP